MILPKSRLPSICEEMCPQTIEKKNATVNDEIQACSSFQGARQIQLGEIYIPSNNNEIYRPSSKNNHNDIEKIPLNNEVQNEMSEDDSDDTDEDDDTKLDNVQKWPTTKSVDVAERILLEIEEKIRDILEQCYKFEAKKETTEKRKAMHLLFANIIPDSKITQFCNETLITGLDKETSKWIDRTLNQIYKVLIAQCDERVDLIRIRREETRKKLILHLPNWLVSQAESIPE